MAATRGAAKKTTSMGSEGSQGSVGIGDGGGGLPPGARDDLPPNLTPEGFSLDPTIKAYDAIIYLIYCPEHDKVVVTNVDRARCVWLPFVCLSESVTWKKACKDGVNNIIGNTNPELDAKVAAKMTPEFEINYLGIFRIQMPTTEKFVTRLANFVLLKKAPEVQFKCCQSSARVTWVPVADILAGKVDKIWGPELLTYTKMLTDKSVGAQTSITTEFTLKNSLYYLLLDGSEEQELLNECQVKAEHIMEIYEDYLEHCYPSFGMAFESFRFYLAKYGYNKNELMLLLKIFNSFSLFGRGYLEFQEMMLGIIAMEPTTKQSNKARARLIVRYYDQDFSGALSAEELGNLVQDVYKQQSLSGEQLKAMVAEVVSKGQLQLNAAGEASAESVVKMLCAGGVLPAEQLCRHPKAILPQISRLIQIKLEGKTKTVDMSLKPRKKGEGTCAGCRGTEYEYSLHAVTLDTIGRCVEPRIINEDWIIPCPEAMMNAHKYSIEYVFSLNSVPNTFLDIIKDFYNKSINPGGEPSNGLMSAKEDWSVIVKYVSILCGELKGLLTNETKLPKINSSAIVIGDLQGNLHDLFEIEKHMFQAFPATPYNLVFLGNYSGVCKWGMECIFYLFALKMCSPNKVFLLRGTNEMRSQNRKTLLPEAQRKYGEVHGKKIFDLVNDIFQRLPFGAVIDETILCAHSGISKSNKIGKLNLIKGDVISVLKDAPVAYDLLVNIPFGLDESAEVGPTDHIKSSDSAGGGGGGGGGGKPTSKIGSQIAANKQHYESVVNVTGFQVSNSYPNAYNFDEVAFENFMRANGFRFFIRSHTPCPLNGYDLRFTNRCLTVYSCSSNNLAQLAKSQERNVVAANKQQQQQQQQQQAEATVVLVEGNNNTLRLVSFNTNVEKPGRRT